MEQLWKKVFCCTCCEQGPCFNYVWSLVANIQSPSEGEKRKQYFFFPFIWLADYSESLTLWPFVLYECALHIPIGSAQTDREQPNLALYSALNTLHNAQQLPPALTSLQCWETSLLGAGKSQELVGMYKSKGWSSSQNTIASIASCWETSCLQDSSAGSWLIQRLTLPIK